MCSTFKEEDGCSVKTIMSDLSIILQFTAWLMAHICVGKEKSPEHGDFPVMMIIGSVHDGDNYNQEQEEETFHILE